MSSIEERLNKELKEALKARDQRVVDAIRMVKTRLTERQKAPGAPKEMSDQMAAEVIASYIKSIRKAMDEIIAAGGTDRPIVEKYRFEIAYLSGFLPKKLGEEETLALVRETVAALGVSGPSHVGRVMGAIMKAHKDVLDPVLLKRLVEQVLCS